MKVHVLFFAQLRDVTGSDHRVVSVEDGLTVGRLVELLRSEWQGTQAATLPLARAVNEEVVDDDHVLREGDRVALLPPVTGG